MRIVDILQEPDDSCSSTSANSMEDISGINGTSGVQKEMKDSSNLFSLPTSSSSSWSKPSPKWVVLKWLASVKKRRVPDPDSSGKQRGGEGKRLGYWARTLVRKRTGKVEGVCDPSPSPSFGSTGKVSLPPEEAEVTFYDHQKPSISGENGDNLGNNFDGSSFNLGVGLGLMFLFAKITNEYNKMIELRKEMETVLKEAKENTQRKDDKSCLTFSAESVNNHSLTYSETSDDKISCNYITFPIHQPYHDDLTSQYPMECDSRSNCIAEPVNHRSMRMDRLEAELETELEQLQVNMEIEDSSRYFRHEDKITNIHLPYDIKVGLAWFLLPFALKSEANIGLDVLFSVFTFQVPDDSCDFSTRENTNFEEKYGIEDENEAQDWGYNCGVCPHELERRLHELLEARQQEQIEELESALQDAERELQEKEIEFYWWRDMARLPHSKSNRSC